MMDRHVLQLNIEHHMWSIYRSTVVELASTMKAVMISMKKHRHHNVFALTSR